MKSIKAFFQDIFKDKKMKRDKKEPRKLPKGKKSNGKGMRIFVWVVLVIVVIAGPISFIRSGNALKKSEAAQKETAQEVDQKLDHEEKYDSPKFKIYADHFVDEYMNIPKTDDREEYNDSLKEFFVSEDFLPDMDFEGKRKLLGKTYYGKEQEGDHVVAQYKAVYETTKKGDDEPNKRDMMIHIPIRYDDGFAVVEPISFGDVPELKSDHQKAVSNPYEEENKDEVSPSDRGKLDDWIEDFFVDYANESEEDMAYMMDDPEALNGLLEFQGINDLHIYKDDDRYIAKVNVTYQEPGADITHQESYTLKIKRMNGQYYVENMEQTLGGK